ncbi:hypothetical protein [Comamonas suwonensis]|uniref:hypothetical protein n=1 Tax=Comamonas suwonensis TaxID=2606214 RepID=UPI00145F5F2A|nr:hypothetical protein [Comamonas suwonensis]MBI1623130.1 hypothetical protein [Comamonas suwonensis]
MTDEHPRLITAQALSDWCKSTTNGVLESRETEVIDPPATPVPQVLEKLQKPFGAKRLVLMPLSGMKKVAGTAG